MTGQDRQEIRAIIENEIAKLKTRIEELRDFTAPVEPDCAIGRISRMDAINNKSIFDASMRNSKKRLQELEQIYRVVNDDSYGICINCHQSIPMERLKIRPEIRKCANCLRK